MKNQAESKFIPIGFVTQKLFNLFEAVYRDQYQTVKTILAQQPYLAKIVIVNQSFSPKFKSALAIALKKPQLNYQMIELLLDNQAATTPFLADEIKTLTTPLQYACTISDAKLCELIRKKTGEFDPKAAFFLDLRFLSFPIPRALESSGSPLVTKIENLYSFVQSLGGLPQIARARNHRGKSFQQVVGNQSVIQLTTHRPHSDFNPWPLLILRHEKENEKAGAIIINEVLIQFVPTVLVQLIVSYYQAAQEELKKSIAETELKFNGPPNPGSKLRRTYRFPVQKIETHPMIIPPKPLTLKRTQTFGDYRTSIRLLCSSSASTFLSSPVSVKKSASVPTNVATLCKRKKLNLSIDPCLFSSSESVDPASTPITATPSPLSPAVPGS